MKTGTWIIVANSSTARIFEAQNNREIVEIETFVHPKSRLKGTDLETDRPGRNTERTGISRFSVNNTHDLKEHEAENFAREISQFLNKAVVSNQVGKIYLVANPSFLGLLRKQLSSPTEKIVAGEVNKDICMMTHEKIREQLPLVL